jgi:NTE family protein
VSIAELIPVTDEPVEAPDDLAIILTGGGARAAYQVGLLRGIARHFPHLRFQIVTGVSSGAINAVFLAANGGTLVEKVERLTQLWCQLECHHVFRPNYARFIPFRTALRSVMPNRFNRRPHGLFNSGPLDTLLRDLFDCHIRYAPIHGIRTNLQSGRLKAVALIGLDYATGQSVRWVQGRDIDVFEGTNRRNDRAELTVEHIMASAALPFVFPAVYIDDRWYGDGGIRLSAPLAPAVHLGAKRILAMSTGHQRTPDEARIPVVEGYPPAAQVISQLVNAIFLDGIEEDVVRMQRMNEMIGQLSPEQRNGFKQIGLFVLRPSKDLGKIAGEFQRDLPRSVRLFTRTLGAYETESPDFVSMLMFEPNYTRTLIELGEHDVESKLDGLRTFFGQNVEMDRRYSSVPLRMSSATVK